MARNESVLIAIALLALLFFLPQVHAAGASISVSPSTIKINVSSQTLVQENVTITSNQTGKAYLYPGANVRSPSFINLTANVPYHLLFTVNVTSSSYTYLNVSQNGTLVPIQIYNYLYAKPFVSSMAALLTVSPTKFSYTITKPELITGSFLLASNQSGNVTILATPGMFLSSSYMPVNAGELYNVTFAINATSSRKYFVNLSEYNAKVSLPITVTFENTTPTVTQNYTISVQGQIAPYSQVVISVLNQNNQLVSSGELEISYDNVTESFNLAANPLPTISFGNLYGFVIVKYYNNGYLVSHAIYSSGISSSVKQKVSLSCPSLQSSSSLNITEFTLTPMEPLQCVLYSQNTFSLITDAHVVAEQNGNIYIPNPQALETGEIVIDPPANGWSIGPLLFLLKSNSYVLAPTMFNVVPAKNPSVLEFTNHTIVQNPYQHVSDFILEPNANLTITINYPNGTTQNTTSQYPIPLSLPVGTTKITTYSRYYTTSQFTVSISKLLLSIRTNTSNSTIYPFTDYEFMTYLGNSLYPYNGEIQVGSNILTFNNGFAQGYLTGSNITSYVINNASFDSVFKESILNLPISIEILGSNGIPTDTLYANQLYEVVILGGSSPVPVSFNLSLSGVVNETVPIKNGQGFFTIPKSGLLTINVQYPGLTPTIRKIMVQPALIIGMNIEELAVILVVMFIVLLFVLGFLGGRKRKLGSISSVSITPTPLTGG